MITIQQKIARMEDELARLKVKGRKLENGQKIIIGGMILSISRNNPDRAKQLLKDIENNVTRKTDLDRLSSITEELRNSLIIRKNE